jgi:hypothetical protein
MNHPISQKHLFRDNLNNKTFKEVLHQEVTEKIVSMVTETEKVITRYGLNSLRIDSRRQPDFMHPS